MKLLRIVGARPNFVKLASVLRTLSPYKEVVSKIIHTGQLYDENINAVFFRQPDLPEPNHHLGIRGGTHTEQAARVMLALEPLLEHERPALLLVGEQSGLENLAKEGIPEEKVHFVGNVMIDTLMHHRREATYSFTLYEKDLLPGEYVLMTLHRPSTVDTLESLERLTRIIISERCFAGASRRI